MRMGWAERLAECEGFQWDAANAGKIRERHRVSPTECEEVFFNHPLVVGDDEKHSADEGRLYALGQTDAARLLFVVFTTPYGYDRLLIDSNGNPVKILQKGEH